VFNAGLGVYQWGAKVAEACEWGRANCAGRACGDWIQFYFTRQNAKGVTEPALWRGRSFCCRVRFTNSTITEK